MGEAYAVGVPEVVDEHAMLFGQRCEREGHEDERCPVLPNACCVCVCVFMPVCMHCFVCIYTYMWMDSVSVSMNVFMIKV